MEDYMLNIKKKSVKKISFVLFSVFCLSCVFIISTLSEIGKVKLQDVVKLHLGNKEILMNYISVNVINLSAVLLIFFLIISIILFIVSIFTRKQKLKSVSIPLMYIFAGAYIILCLFVFIIQDDLRNRDHLGFEPIKINKELSDSYIKNNVEEINLLTPDNVLLNGWLVKGTEKQKSPLIIYFTGATGGEVFDIINHAKKLNSWSFAIVSYRGYGFSEGFPTQEAVLSDALFIYDTFSKRNDIDKDRIVAMGHSLGTGVAVYLSEKRKIAATILSSPILRNSIGSPIQLQLVPTSFIMRREPVDTIYRAPFINNPLLCLIGEKDTNTLPKDSLKLVEKWKGRSSVKIYKGEGHKFIYNNENSWADISEFLKTIE